MEVVGSFDLNIRAVQPRASPQRYLGAERG